MIQIEQKLKCVICGRQKLGFSDFKMFCVVEDYMIQHLCKRCGQKVKVFIKSITKSDDK